jgi:hypothetical protein
MSDRLEHHFDSAAADIRLKNSGKRSYRRQSLFDSCSLNGRMEIRPARRRPTIQLKKMWLHRKQGGQATGGNRQT